MQKIIDGLETSFFILLTVFLCSLFLLNLPLFQEPHGFLVMNELSDFSSNQLSTIALFGSALLCVLLGCLTLKWAPALTVGMASNLWATTFFLLWVDSMFTLCIQSHSLHYLVLLGLGLLFLYLFFFTVYYLGLSAKPEVESGGAAHRERAVSYWLVFWMGFYFLVSIRLLFNSYGFPQFQGPLAMGFCALGFLNYLVFLFLQKHQGADLRLYSRIGRIVFSLWFLTVLAAEIGQKWIQ